MKYHQTYVYYLREDVLPMLLHTKVEDISTRSTGLPIKNYNSFLQRQGSVVQRMHNTIQQINCYPALLTLLTPRSDQHETSPYNILTLSSK